VPDPQAIAAAAARAGEADPRIAVLHVTGSAAVGGAETALLKLLATTPQREFRCAVIVLGADGQIGDEIRRLGIPIVALQLRRDRPHPRAAWQLLRQMRLHGPHVVQTWMYHADLAGGLAARLLRAPVIWGIRGGTLDPLAVPATTLRVQKACARLSRYIPDVITCCSRVARDIHVRIGYDAQRMQVIPNGFDITLWRPDPVARREFRRELGITDDHFVIGMVARYNPQKDFPTFARAAGLLAERTRQARFVLCGEGVTMDNAELVALLRRHGVLDRVHALGMRRDLYRLNNAFDIATLASSWGEGFPNVLGEAMACAVPCVATNQGDVPDLIADTGRIVESRDPRALANAWAELAALSPEARQQLGLAARNRVARMFSLRAFSAAFHDLHRTLAARSRFAHARAAA
jgi:glycosyltransferase involved in cell wall biosynthesis